MKNILFACISALIILSLPSCGSRLKQITFLKSADITLPDHIQTIGTLDRSKPKKQLLNALEGLITGEGLFQDRDGRSKSIAGFTNIISATPRFTIRPILQEMETDNASKNFSTPLTWEEVDKLCQTYGVDAIAALEVYDSDAFTTPSNYIKETKDADGNIRKTTVYRAERSIDVKTGFRLYDPKQRMILDEFITRHLGQDVGEASNANDAVRNLGSPVNQINIAAQISGEQYARRIAPLEVREGRVLYTKAHFDKHERKTAKKALNKNDWNTCISIWKEAANNPDTKPKIAAKASHNLAVASEYQGNLSLALQYAEMVQKKYDKHYSTGYAIQLRQRINDQQRLNDQMKSK